MCRIGRSVSYCNGISPRGKVYYDHILSIFGDKFAPYVMSALTHFEVQRKIETPSCRVKAKEALGIVKQSVVNTRIIECLDFLIDNILKTGKCVFDSRFKKLSNGYMKW